MTRIKICGLSTRDTVDAALAAGADMLGFVFFEASPRNVSLDHARDLARRVEGRANIVALTVDADDALIDAIVAAVTPDAFQLHGCESPERVASLRTFAGRDMIKAIGVADACDIARAQAYRAAAATILFDAKPPRGGALPGGNGMPFDWAVLRDVAVAPPWMLSGGLTAQNVGEALQITRAPCVDVSSGVEIAPGMKDAALIRDFISAARGVSPEP